MAEETFEVKLKVDDSDITGGKLDKAVEKVKQFPKSVKLSIGVQSSTISSRFKEVTSDILATAKKTGVAVDDIFKNVKGAHSLNLDKAKEGIKNYLDAMIAVEKRVNAAKRSSMQISEKEAAQQKEELTRLGLIADKRFGQMREALKQLKAKREADLDAAVQSRKTEEQQAKAAAKNLANNQKEIDALKKTQATYDESFEKRKGQILKYNAAIDALNIKNKEAREIVTETFDPQTMNMVRAAQEAKEKLTIPKDTNLPTVDAPIDKSQYKTIVAKEVNAELQAFKEALKDPETGAGKLARALEQAQVAAIRFKEANAIQQKNMLGSTVFGENTPKKLMAELANFTAKELETIESFRGKNLYAKEPLSTEEDKAEIKRLRDAEARVMESYTKTKDVSLADPELSRRLKMFMAIAANPEVKEARRKEVWDTGAEARNRDPVLSKMSNSFRAFIQELDKFEQEISVINTRIAAEQKSIEEEMSAHIQAKREEIQAQIKEAQPAYLEAGQKLDKAFKSRNTLALKEIKLKEDLNNDPGALTTAEVTAKLHVAKKKVAEATKALKEVAAEYKPLATAMGTLLDSVDKSKEVIIKKYSKKISEMRADMQHGGAFSGGGNIGGAGKTLLGTPDEEPDETRKLQNANMSLIEAEQRQAKAANDLANAMIEGDTPAVLRTFRLALQNATAELNQIKGIRTEVAAKAPEEAGAHELSMLQQRWIDNAEEVHKLLPIIEAKQAELEQLRAQLEGIKPKGAPTSKAEMRARKLEVQPEGDTTKTIAEIGRVGTELSQLEKNVKSLQKDMALLHNLFPKEIEGIKPGTIASFTQEQKERSKMEREALMERLKTAATARTQPLKEIKEGYAVSDATKRAMLPVRLDPTFVANAKTAEEKVVALAKAFQWLNQVQAASTKLITSAEKLKPGSKKRLEIEAEMEAYKKYNAVLQQYGLAVYALRKNKQSGVFTFGEFSSSDKDVKEFIKRAQAGAKVSKDNYMKDITPFLTPGVATPTREAAKAINELRDQVTLLILGKIPQNTREFYELLGDGAKQARKEIKETTKTLADYFGIVRTADYETKHGGSNAARVRTANFTSRMQQLKENLYRTSLARGGEYAPELGPDASEMELRARAEDRRRRIRAEIKLQKGKDESGTAGYGKGPLNEAQRVQAWQNTIINAQKQMNDMPSSVALAVMRAMNELKKLGKGWEGLVDNVEDYKNAVNRAASLGATGTFKRPTEATTTAVPGMARFQAASPEPKTRFRYAMDDIKMGKDLFKMVDNIAVVAGQGRVQMEALARLRDIPAIVNISKDARTANTEIDELQRGLESLALAGDKISTALQLGKVTPNSMGYKKALKDLVYYYDQIRTRANELAPTNKQWISDLLWVETVLEKVHREFIDIGAIKPPKVIPPAKDPLDRGNLREYHKILTEMSQLRVFANFSAQAKKAHPEIAEIATDLRVGAHAASNVGNALANGTIKNVQPVKKAIKEVVLWLDEVGRKASAVFGNSNYSKAFRARMVPIMEETARVRALMESAGAIGPIKAKKGPGAGASRIRVPSDTEVAIGALKDISTIPEMVKFSTAAKNSSKDIREMSVALDKTSNSAMTLANKLELGQTKLKNKETKEAIIALSESMEGLGIKAQEALNAGVPKQFRAQVEMAAKASAVVRDILLDIGLIKLPKPEKIKPTPPGQRVADQDVVGLLEYNKAFEKMQRLIGRTDFTQSASAQIRKLGATLAQEAANMGTVLQRVNIDKNLKIGSPEFKRMTKESAEQIRKVAMEIEHAFSQPQSDAAIKELERMSNVVYILLKRFEKLHVIEPPKVRVEKEEGFAVDIAVTGVPPTAMSSLEGIAASAADMGKFARSSNGEVRTLVELYAKAANEAGRLAQAVKSGEVVAGTSEYKAALAQLSNMFNIIKISAEEAMKMPYNKRNIGELKQILDITNKTAAAMVNLGSKVKEIKGGVAYIDPMIKKMNQATSATNGWVKSISRVMSGILISQGFYKMLFAVQQAIGSMTTYILDMEAAQASMAIMLDNSQASAKAFLNATKRLAIDYGQDVGAVIEDTKLLMAYGFQAVDTLSMLPAMMDMAAIRKDATVIEKLTRAMGQLKAGGTLKGTEVKKFYEAGVPILDILNEKLGLHVQTIAQLGRLNLTAGKVIPALLEGIDDRYGGAAKALANTTRGLLTQIASNMKLVGQIIFQPGFDEFKVVLRSVLAGIVELYDTVNSLGPGGLFEKIFPSKQTQKELRIIVGYLVFIKAQFAGVGKALGENFGGLGKILVQTLEVVAPVLAMIANGIRTLIENFRAGNTVVRAFVYGLLGLVGARQVVLLLSALFGGLRAVGPLGGVVTIIARIADSFRLLFGVIGGGSLAGLSGMSLFMGRLTRFASIGTLVIGVIGGIVAATKWGQTWISRFVNGLLKLLGIDINKILQPVKQSVKDISAYTGPLDDMTDTIEEDAKAAAEASKKFVAAFDEVYQVPEDATTELPETKLPDMSPFTGVTDSLDNIQEKTQGFYLRWKDIWKIILEVFEHGRKLLSLGLQALGEIFALVLPKIGQTLLTLFPHILQTITGVIPLIVRTLGEVVFAIISSLSILLPRIGLAISDWIFKVQMPFLKDNFVAIAAIVLNELGYLTLQLLLAIGGMGASLGITIFKLAVPIVTGLGAVMQITGRVLKALAKSLWDGVKTAFEELGKMLNYYFTVFIPEIFTKGYSVAMDNMKAWEAKIIYPMDLDWLQRTKDALSDEALGTEAVFAEMTALNEDAAMTLDAAQQLLDDTVFQGSDLLESYRKEAEADLAARGYTVEAISSDYFKKVGVFVEEQKKDFAGTGALLKDVWTGVGESIGPAWKDFFDKTNTNYTTWWTSEGKPLWEGTGVDINTILGKYLTLGKEEFALFWKDVSIIQKEAQDRLKTPGTDSIKEYIAAQQAQQGAIKKMQEEALAQREIVAKSEISIIEQVQKAKNTAAMQDAANLAARTAQNIARANGDPFGLTDYIKAYNEALEKLKGAAASTESVIATSTKASFEDILSFRKALEDNKKASDQALLDSQSTFLSTIHEGLAKASSELPSAFAEKYGSMKNIGTNLANSVLSGVNNVLSAAKPSLGIKVYADFSIINQQMQAFSGNQQSLKSYTGAIKSAGQQMATGGIVDRPTLATIGEKGKEAVVPLSSEALTPWAQAIVNQMALNGGNNGGGNPEYVAVSIKTSDLVNLERQLFMVRKSEAVRVAGRA